MRSKLLLTVRKYLFFKAVPEISEFQKYANEFSDDVIQSTKLTECQPICIRNL